MARKRRRRRGSEQAEIEPDETLPASDGDSEDAEEAFGLTFEDGHGDAHGGEDHSCLTHPGYNLNLKCGRCQDSMCEMCAVDIKGVPYCAECLALELRRRKATPWRGWLAMAAGLVAVAAVLAPFTIAPDHALMGALPGGRVFFSYAALGAGIVGLASGLAMQDFSGIERRAGMIGASLSLVVLVAGVMMNSLKIFLG